MRKPRKERLEKLLALATSQYGYFTTAQALNLGYGTSSLVYHARQGNWEHVTQGLYRLPGSVSSMAATFTFWTLWSANQNGQPQAIISHESALALHELAEFDPQLTHLTVPFGFRKPGRPDCVLHKAHLNLSAIESRDTFLVTSLPQTLHDLQSVLQDQGRWGQILERARTKSPELAGADWNRSRGPVVSAAVEVETSAELTAYTPLGPGTPLDGAIAAPDQSPADSPLEPQTVSASPVAESQPMSERVFAMMYERFISPGSRRRAQAGFTLVELLVVTAIISVLAAMLVPVLEKARNAARDLACGNNCKQHGLLMQTYAGENADYLPNLNATLAPNSGRWWDTLSYLYDARTAALYLCATEQRVSNVLKLNTNGHLYGYGSYGMNTYLYSRPPLSLASGVYSDGGGVPVHLRQSQIVRPSGCDLTADTFNPLEGVANPQMLYPYFGADPSTWGGKFAVRHRNGGNFLWADGHITWQLATMADQNKIEWFSPSGH